MKGMALILTLLVLSACSAFGAALMLVVMPERLAGGSYRDNVTAVNAADGALEIAARELGAINDWNAVLAGTRQSSFIDGSPGVRQISRRDDIDLEVLTNQLTCERTTFCSDGDVRVRTLDRPWGNNNPRWRLFLHTMLSVIAAAPEFQDVYVVVWVGDDGSEADGNPLIDGGAASGAGASILRVRVESFGPGPTRRTIEANVVRRDRTFVQSWRTLTLVVP